MPAKAKPIAERFWPKVDRRGDDECWPWLASKHPFGYGRMTAGRGVNLKAHRVSYEIANGVIPAGGNVLHRCDNPTCCNPRHLFLGTKKDNTHDMLSKGRNSPPPHTFGEKHHNAKFDAATARKIMEDKRTLAVIAAENKISWMTVFRLKHRQTWKKLEPYPIVRTPVPSS